MLLQKLAALDLPDKFLLYMTGLSSSSLKCIANGVCSSNYVALLFQSSFWSCVSASVRVRDENKDILWWTCCIFIHDDHNQCTCSSYLQNMQVTASTHTELAVRLLWDISNQRPWTPLSILSLKVPVSQLPYPWTWCHPVIGLMLHPHCVGLLWHNVIPFTRQI